MHPSFVCFYTKNVLRAADTRPTYSFLLLLYSGNVTLFALFNRACLQVYYNFRNFDHTSQWWYKFHPIRRRAVTCIHLRSNSQFFHTMSTADVITCRFFRTFVRNNHTVSITYRRLDLRRCSLFCSWLTLVFPRLPIAITRRLRFRSVRLQLFVAFARFYLRALAIHRSHYYPRSFFSPCWFHVRRMFPDSPLLPLRPWAM